MLATNHNNNNKKPAISSTESTPMKLKHHQQHQHNQHHQQHQHHHQQENNNTMNINMNNMYVPNWQKSMWKSHGGAKRFFMPLPNRRFQLMHHHEIEQVLRKQLSHMCLPDPLNADFYCGVIEAREGKPWAGFGVPGLNHVYVAKCRKYPKHLDGSPILPPGTLGKTAGFVSVHAPKSMISIGGGNVMNIDGSGRNINKLQGIDEKNSTENNDIDIIENKYDEEIVKKKINFNKIGDNDECIINSLKKGGIKNVKDYYFTDRDISKQIEIGFDYLMMFERCNASIFYVHQQSQGRMIYNTTNGLINSRSQRDDMNLFNLCLKSRDNNIRNLIQFLDLTNPNKKFYKLSEIDKGRKLIYRILQLFEANNYVFIAMLKLLCAKIYLFATVQKGKKISDQDIQFPDKLKSLLNPQQFRYYKQNYDQLLKQYKNKKKVYKFKIQSLNDSDTESEEDEDDDDEEEEGDNDNDNNDNDKEEENNDDPQERNNNNKNDKKKNDKKMDKLMDKTTKKQFRMKEIEKIKLDLVRMENQLNYLRELIPPRLSTENALIIFNLILKNLSSFKNIEDRKLLFKSRLICCIMSVIIKVSKPNQQEWIESFQQLFNSLGNDLTFLVPGLTRLQGKVQALNIIKPSNNNNNSNSNTHHHHSHHHRRRVNPFSNSVIIPQEMTKEEIEIISSNPNVHERKSVFEGREYYKLTGKHLSQWSVLMASPRIRWELVCDIYIGCDPNSQKKLINLPKFWNAVKDAMLHFPPARFMALKHPQLKNELCCYFNTMKQKARIQLQQIQERQQRILLLRKQQQQRENEHIPDTPQSLNRSKSEDNSNNDDINKLSPLQPIKRAHSTPDVSDNKKSDTGNKVNDDDSNNDDEKKSNDKQENKDNKQSSQGSNNNNNNNNNNNRNRGNNNFNNYQMYSNHNNNNSMNGLYNPHPYMPAHAQSMHHYVHQMRGWLNAFKKNEAKQLEKERQHQINMQKQTKRQREYEKMLQQKKDLQNERFKQQFFKQLEERKLHTNNDNDNNDDDKTDKNNKSMTKDNDKQCIYKHLQSSSVKKLIIPQQTDRKPSKSVKNKAKNASKYHCKDEVIIKTTTPDLDANFTFAFEVAKSMDNSNKTHSSSSTTMPPKGKRNSNYRVKQKIMDDDKVKKNENKETKKKTKQEPTPTTLEQLHTKHLESRHSTNDNNNNNNNISDDVSSCSSSDTGSLLSMGIGVDPFTLNKRYYNNIMSEPSSSTTTTKNDDNQSESKTKTSDSLSRDTESDRAMMLAHGMQQVVDNNNSDTNRINDRNSYHQQQVQQQSTQHQSSQQHSNAYRDHNSNNNSIQYGGHLISPGVHVNHSRNRYYGHNHHYYYYYSQQQQQQQSQSMQSSSSSSSSSTRRREHYQYDRYRSNNRKSSSRYNNNNDIGYNGQLSSSSIYDNEYTSQLPPRMRGSGSNNDNININNKSRDRNNNKHRDRKHSSHRDNKYKNRNDRNNKNNNNSRNRNNNKSSSYRNDRMYDDRDRIDRIDRDDRIRDNRYRNRDRDNDRYRYKNQYNSNSKQYNYSRSRKR